MILFNEDSIDRDQILSLCDQNKLTEANFSLIKTIKINNDNYHHAQNIMNDLKDKLFSREFFTNLKKGM